MPIRWDAPRTALASIAEAVGRTPLVRLNRVTAAVKPEVLLKIEWYGPTGSLKDRIYLHMFERAEARGELTRGMRVLECSTGNAGIACAFVAAVKGYACTIVMPEGMSDERKKIMRAYGADLVFTPGGESDVDLALARLAEIRAGDPAGYWVPGQFDNADSVEAHYRTTGPEIWEQCGGRVGAFVAAQGSGGTLTGVGRLLRERDPRVRLYAVEPDECALLARREWGPHGIEGIGDGFVPANLDVALLSGVITTTTDESVAMARRLEAKPKSAAEKLTSLEDAVARIKDGDHVAVGGCLFSRTPMALVRELLRERRRGLTLSRNLTCTEGEFLMVAGAVERIVTAWMSIGLPWGVSKILRHFVESGRVALEEWSHLGLGMCCW